MTRPRFSRGFDQGQRRSSGRIRPFWGLGPGGDDLATMDVQAISANVAVILGSGITPVGQPLTILRTHGFLEIQFTAIASANDGFSWACGFGIGSLDAFNAGAASLPNPFDDIDWKGWLWHQMGAVHSPTATLADMGSSIFRLIEIDSKSMRILGLNEVGFLMFQAGETGVATIQVRAGTRVLTKVTQNA